MARSRNLDNPTLLALDTATEGCSVAVWRDGAVLASEAQPMARGQASALMPMIERVIGAAGTAPADLDAVCVTRGPGAFTGLRIALSAARGLALALDVPCIGVTTLEAVAAGVPAQERGSAKVLACVESKREDIFVQVFSENLAPLTEPLALGAEALGGLFADGESVVLVGDAAARAHAMLADSPLSLTMSSAAQLPDPGTVAVLAKARLGMDGPPPEPLYLRPPDAKLPKAEGRLRV